jgi:hypothetical protein
VVPSLRRLLQIVEELVELTHQLEVGGVDKACGLGAVDRLEESDLGDLMMSHLINRVIRTIRRPN